MKQKKKKFTFMVVLGGCAEKKVAQRMDIYEQFRAALRHFVKLEGHGSISRIRTQARVGYTTFYKITHGSGSKGRGTEETRRAIAAACGYEYQSFLDIGRSLLEHNLVAARLLIKQKNIRAKRRGERSNKICAKIPRKDGSFFLFEVGTLFSGGEGGNSVLLDTDKIVIVDDE